MHSAPNKPELDGTSLALLRLQLAAGEQLLWAGRPRWWRDRLPLMALSLAILADSATILLFRVLLPGHRLHPFAHGIPVISGYLSLAAAGVFTSYNHDRDSLFALTDRRAIRMWPIYFVPYINERGEPVNIRRRMFGRLTIGDTQTRSCNGSQRWIKPGVASFLDFFAILHPKEVLQIALEAQQRELRNRSSRAAA